jgi:opacity protein-like surface antigen
MTRLFLTLAAGLSITLSASPVGAQTIGLQGYFTYGTTMFAATDTLEAVTGDASATGVGFGATITNIWRQLFVDVGIQLQTLDGERVFAVAGQVYSLGTPTTIKTQSVDIVAGWRVPIGRIIPYAGAGLSVISYSETSPFANPGDDVDESASGLGILGGVDVMVVRWVRVGGEFRFRLVEGVLGNQGLSAALGDDQLGGSSVALRVSVGR